MPWLLHISIQARCEESVLCVFPQSASYTDLSWDIPLESLRSRQIRMGFSFTVAIFCVAQLNRVHRERMLYEKHHQGLH